MSAYIQFGSGLLFVNPTGGNEAVNPTPTKGLTIQDITMDIAGEIKSLKGQYQFPDDTAAADKKGTFKFAMGRKDFTMLSQIFFADTVAAGGTSVATNVAGTIPANPGPYTVAPAVPGGGTWSVDLGVSFGLFGVELTKVASGPAAGQYSVSAGTYTFAAADHDKAVVISFAYTLSSAGATYQVNQQPQGYGPQFESFIVDTYQPVSGVYSVVRLAACKIAKVGMVNKRVDYSMPELEGEYFARSDGRVIDFYSNVG